MSIYYPNDQVNFISTILIDTPYNMGYLMNLAGLAMVSWLQKDSSFIKVESKNLEMAPNTHMVIFTDSNNVITHASQNFSYVFGNESHHKNLSTVLGVSSSEMDRITNDARKKKTLDEQNIRIKIGDEEKTAYLSATVIELPGNPWSGLVILLRLVSNDLSLDDQLEKYDREIVEFMLNKTGIKEKEENEFRQFVSGYYLLYIQPLFQLLQDEGGDALVESLQIDLGRVARQYGCQLVVQPDFHFDLMTTSRSDYCKCFPVLFDNSPNNCNQNYRRTDG